MQPTRVDNYRRKGASLTTVPQAASDVALELTRQSVSFTRLNHTTARTRGR